MNDEYIRRVEAEEAIEEYCCRRCKEYSEVEGGCVSHAQHCEHLSGEEILKPVKSADVQPVKHGRWEQIGKQSAKCAACGGVLRSNGIDKTGKALIFNAVYHYCPFCGARMDGDTEGRCEK